MSTKSDRIAISGERHPSSLKQRLLFFDRIGIAEPEAEIALLRVTQRAESLDLANDLEFLQSKNLLFNLPWSLRSLDHKELVTEEEKAAAHIFKAAARTWVLPRARYDNMQDILRYAIGRLAVQSLSQSEAIEASVVRSAPLVLPKKLRTLLPASFLQTGVIDVVLDKLPMPSEQLPGRRF